MRILALLLAAQLAQAGQANYIGGTLTTLTEGQGGNVDTTDQIFFAFYSHKTSLRIAYDRINLVEYGQKVDRRYLSAALISPLLILAKKKTHFLTVGFADEQGRQQAMIFRVEKGSIRTLLVCLEARTGIKVQFQDEEARKAGKG